MKLKPLLVVTFGLLLLVCFHAARAQTPNTEMSSKVIKARKSNAALMHRFTWNCRTELMDHGKVKDIRIDLVTYGPDDQLKRTVLNDQGSHLPIGFLRRSIAQSKKKQTEQYLAGLRKLLDQYTLPTEGRINDFIGSANVEFTHTPEGTTLLHISGDSVVVPGDTLSIWVDTSTHAIRKVQITTNYDGDAANVTAAFKTLAASHLTYMSMAEVAVPAKGMTLQVQNYDYEQSD